MSWHMPSGRCCCPGGSTPQQFYRRRSFEVIQFCKGELRSICHCSLCNLSVLERISLPGFCCFVNLSAGMAGTRPSTTLKKRINRSCFLLSSSSIYTKCNVAIADFLGDKVTYFKSHCSFHAMRLMYERHKETCIKLCQWIFPSTFNLFCTGHCVISVILTYAIQQLRNYINIFKLVT